MRDRDNGLAIEMAFYSGGRPVRLPLRQGRDAARICVLVHGLGCNEGIWSYPADPGPGDTTYGAMLEADLGFRPFYVRYNSGLSIAENGKALVGLVARLVESLGAVEDVVLIGHSMGGLVVRSACHYAVQHGAAWVERVRRVVYLGTPHDGADLERVARAAESMLRSVSNPITRLVGDVIGVRSQGVKDLGCGTLLEPDVMDDWPANTTAHHRRAVPWLAHARHYVVSGTLTDDPDHIAALVFGDGLVARGGDLDALSAHHVEVFPGVHHFELARSPRVYAAIREWCTAGEG